MRTTPESFDLASTFVHLGLGSVAVELPDFEWSAECLDRYDKSVEADGEEGRLVCITPHTDDWTSWERHPSGDEVVVVLSGRVEVIQELSDRENRVELGPGQAVINPRGVWHTADVREPGLGLFITPGLGTHHRPRA